jgi:hypothetical protein
MRRIHGALHVVADDPAAFAVELRVDPLTREIIYVNLAQRRTEPPAHAKRKTRLWPRDGAFQMAEVAIPKNLFADILRLIAELRLLYRLMDQGIEERQARGRLSAQPATETDRGGAGRRIGGPFSPHALAPLC